MISTAILVPLFAGLLAFSVTFWGLLLRFGLRWAKVQDVTKSRLVVATVVVFAFNLALNLMSLSIVPKSNGQLLLQGLSGLAAAFLIPAGVICIVFKTRYHRALLAWLPTLVASAIIVSISSFVIRPFVFESFQGPTNGMAPTIVGQHRTGVCPECGKQAYCAPKAVRYGSDDDTLMICESFHAHPAASIEETTLEGDRILVSHFLAPRRWDLLVFRYPEDANLVYVKRLVGLPGEKVHIEDGSVWVDGERQTPPKSMDGLEYLSEVSLWYGPKPWGSPSRPASLAEDEYFVLGDFSAQSTDSRHWQRGALGHNPFAVPTSYVIGVVTHTFWPLQRWKIHR